jgi:hypothetical protein
VTSRFVLGVAALYLEVVLRDAGLDGNCEAAHTAAHARESGTGVHADVAESVDSHLEHTEGRRRRPRLWVQDSGASGTTLKLRKGLGADGQRAWGRAALVQPGWGRMPAMSKKRPIW